MKGFLSHAAIRNGTGNRPLYMEYSIKGHNMLLVTSHSGGSLGRLCPQLVLLRQLNDGSVQHQMGSNNKRLNSGREDFKKILAVGALP